MAPVDGAESTRSVNVPPTSTPSRQPRMRSPRLTARSRPTRSGAPPRVGKRVYEQDDRANRIGAGGVGAPQERIVRGGRFAAHGEPANFWWMHAAGPCGPCSEVFVDRGPAYGPEGGPDADEDRFCEIWNLVFMQDECDDEGNEIAELPKKSIDTGSSLERVAMVLQDARNAFETDIMRPFLAVAERVTGVAYGADEKADVSLRIMAEHG